MRSKKTQKKAAQLAEKAAQKAAGHLPIKTGHSTANLIGAGVFSFLLGLIVGIGLGSVATQHEFGATPKQREPEPDEPQR